VAPESDALHHDTAGDDTAIAGPAADDATVPIVAARRRRRRWPWLLLALVLLAAAAAGATLAAIELLEDTTHEVPPTAGLDEAAARALVADYQWDVDIRRVRSDDEPEAGVVIGTEPEAGVELGEGEPFLIIVSDGPEFRALPELVGLTQEAALAALADLQLAGTIAEPQFDEAAPLGRVLSWTVPDQPTLVAGDPVLPGTPVAITVSAGPAPRVVPDVANLALAEATAALDAVQLTITELEPVFSDTVPAGVVIAQDPPAGTELARGSTVGVTLSKGPDVVVLPDLSGLTLSEVTAALQSAGFTIGNIIGLTEGTFAQAKIGGEAVAAGGTYPRGTQVDLAFL
jgi:serine/threonine-protein kinase